MTNDERKVFNRVAVAEKKRLKEKRFHGKFEKDQKAEKKMKLGKSIIRSSNGERSDKDDDDNDESTSVKYRAEQKVPVLPEGFSQNKSGKNKKRAGLPKHSLGLVSTSELQKQYPFSEESFYAEEEEDEGDLLGYESMVDDDEDFNAPFESKSDKKSSKRGKRGKGGKGPRPSSGSSSSNIASMLASVGTTMSDLAASVRISQVTPVAATPPQNQMTFEQQKQLLELQIFFSAF